MDGTDWWGLIPDRNRAKRVPEALLALDGRVVVVSRFHLAADISLSYLLSVAFGAPTVRAHSCFDFSFLSLSLDRGSVTCLSSFLERPPCRS